MRTSRVRREKQLSDERGNLLMERGAREKANEQEEMYSLVGQRVSG